MKFLPVILVSLLLCACHNAKPPEYPDGQLPPSGQTPGDGDSGNDGDSPANDFAESLADPTPRYVGPELTLLYSDGGVMAIRRSDGTRELVDLDGPSRASLSFGAMNAADSLLSKASLSVNGVEVAIVSARLARRTATAEWVVVHDADGGAHLFVIDL